MWPFSKKPVSADLPPVVAASIIISAVALMLSAGVLRWSWLLVDEQIRIRKDVMELQNTQEQVNIQYEYWLGKLQDERAEWQKMNEAR